MTANDYTPTTEEVRTAFGNYFREEACCDEHALWDYDGAFNRWLVEEIRYERDAERRGIMDLLEEMIQYAVEGDDLEGLCLFREALWERNDK